MIAQVGRSAACIRQLHVQCLTACLASPGPKHLERVLNLHTLLPIRDGLSKTFISLQTHRSYATRPVSRPKQHTGRTTSTRKTPTTSATKAAKVPRPKKATAKSTPKAKSKAKPKPRKKAKGRSKSKPKPKSKRKILTEKQKQQKATKVQKDKIASLKEAALQPPVGTPRTAWSVLLVETVKTQRSGSGRAPNASKEASQKFKSLSPEELEHYNHLANQNRERNARAYRDFIESHSPLQIYDANIARRHLTRLAKAKPRPSGQRWPALKDERQVKRPLSAFAQFYTDRQSTDDYRGMSIATRAGLASREWKALAPGEKKPYEERAVAESERYRQELKTVLGKDLKLKKKPT